MKAGLDRRMLEEIADIESVQEILRRSGVQASDQLFVNALRKTPQFFNAVTGAFDEKSYEGLLAQNSITPVEYQNSVKDSIALEHFSSGMSAGLRAPMLYSALIAILETQQRSSDYFVLDQKAVEMPQPPTDAELVKFIKANEAALRRPELRVISLMRISATDLAQTAPADPAVVQKLFDLRKASLSVPERRSFVQVPAKDAAQAAEIAARLAKGENATTLGQAYHVKPISYPNASKSSVADPKVGDAVFALQAGQTSAPIQGAFGYSVVKLAGVTPGKPAAIEDVRAQLEAEVKQQAATEQAEDQANKYGDAHASGAPMAKAATTAGAKIFALGPLTADGKMFPTGQPVASLNQRMLTEAFTLPQGGETDITDLGKGEYYALRVEQVTPSAIPSLDQVRPQLIQAFMAQGLMKRLQDKANGLAARLRKGEDVGAVAASAGVKAQHIDGLSRANAGQQQALGQEFLVKLFQAKTNDVFLAGIPQVGLAVGKLTAIRPGAPADVARLTVRQRPQLTQEISARELVDMLQTAARDTVKPRVDEALARSAIHASPDEGGPAGGGPGKPAGS